MPAVAQDARYPIGKYETAPYSEEQRQKYIRDIKLLPQDLEIAIQALDEHQLDTPYREGGWTIKQLVHHIADSHMNAYIRFKWGMTEDNPTIKVYEEKDWANLGDVFSVPVNISVTLLHALHRRWVAFLEQKNNISALFSIQSINVNCRCGFCWGYMHGIAGITLRT